MSDAPAVIEVRDVTLGYGERVIQKDLSFDVRRGEVFVILGGSGCGKSSLLKHMIGLDRPRHGQHPLRRRGHRPRPREPTASASCASSA